MISILETIKSKNKSLSWIQDNTVLVVKHGSKAYGTDVDSSDDDYKGITIPTKSYFLGTLNFEQAELSDPDVVIYEIRKFFSLAKGCNPNIIEVLHVNPSDYVFVDAIGEIILEHKDKFLSNKIVNTFGGYAHSQLHRINLHRSWLLNPVEKMPTRSDFGLPEASKINPDQLSAVEAEVKKHMEKYNFSFVQNLPLSEKIEFNENVAAIIADMKINIDDLWMATAKSIGIEDNFIQIMQKEKAFLNQKKNFDNYQNWKKTRNKKRYADELNFGYDLKHAYHLIRLLRMCLEMITTGKVIVKRPDREELLAIRRGSLKYEELIEMADKIKLEILREQKNSKLPSSCDEKYLDNLCIKLIEKSLNNNSFYRLNKNIQKHLNKIIF